MSGTKAGGLKARQTNYERHGEDFYARIGKKGGVNGHTGGFAANPELARKAGAKGGKKSRRGPSYDADWHRIEHVALKMDKEGASVKEISDFTGMSYFALRERLRKARNDK